MQHAYSIPLETVEEAPRVYSYTRFSTPEQAEGDSKRRQTEGARRWMEKKNAEREREQLSPLAFDERLNLADLGVSAFRGANTGEDKGLGGFLHACRAGLIPAGSYLIVESLDRISRMTPRKVSRIIDDIVDAGVVLATLSDGQEYDAERLNSDPTALLMSLMVSWRAHEESKMKGQRLAAAWAEKRQRVRDGRDAKLTGKGPSWLQWTVSGWQEHPTNAEIVRRIFRLTLEGMGEHKIAQTFNSDRVPVMGRGKMWHRSTIAKVLRSQSVIGTLQPGRMEHSEGRKVRRLEQPIPNAFPAVISKSDWTAVQALKDGKAPAVRGRGAAAPLSNFLAGLARCPECGATMTRVSKGSSAKGGNPKLVCTRAKQGAADHGYRSVDLATVEAAFRDKWQTILANIPVGEGGSQLDKQHADLIGSIEAIEGELTDIDRRHGDRLTQVARIRRQALEAFVASYRASLDEIELQRAVADHGLVRSG